MLNLIDINQVQHKFYQMICFICSKYDKNHIVLYNRLTICKSCYIKNHGFKCKYCRNHYLHNNNIHPNICQYCYKGQNQQADNKLLIHNYFFKPYPTFFKIKKQLGLYFGIQLEIGGVKNPTDVNMFASNNQDQFFYMKYDSTIPKYGCEIVTYPATLEYHECLKKWKILLNNAKLNKFKSYDIDDCGIHIHINKNFFTNNQISMIDYFINRNKNFIVKISRRESLFSRFLNKPFFLWGKPLNLNRHCALNLLNQNTIQFRFFKGTLKYQSIMAYIEFIYSVSMFVIQFDNLKDFIANIDSYFLFIKQLNNIKYLIEYLKKIDCLKF